MTGRPTFEVFVGNIGMVYTGPSQLQARKAFDAYVEQSKNGYGRVSNEPVYIMQDGESVIDEYQPDNGDDT